MARTEATDDFPDQAQTALLLIDVINDLEFEEGELLLRHALPAARRIAALKERARAAGLPVVYVNDNFGKWQSDFRRLVDHCLQEGVRGRPIAELLRPGDEDYFVLKPRHSGFFGTTLALLLEGLGVKRLLLAGYAGDICVLLTAADAYLRDYEIAVPADCVASNDAGHNREALAYMERVLRADVTPSTELRLGGDGATPPAPG